MQAARKISLWVAGAVLFLIASSGAPTQSRAVFSQQSVSQESQNRRLRLYNTHTAERIELVYRQGDQYVSGALAKLDYFLRDHRTGDVRHFDPRLYDILSDLTSSIGNPGGEIDIICGYRTSSTNESLRAHTTGVAKNSLHIQAEEFNPQELATRKIEMRRATIMDSWVHAAATCGKSRPSFVLPLATFLCPAYNF